VKTEIVVTNCSCIVCSGMCERPCWPTPKQAKTLIERGYGGRLMLDRWCASPDILLLCPASKGFEGKEAPWNPHTKEGCTFWKNGLCELHELGLKPLEGQVAIHGKDQPELHHDVAFLWDNPKARTLVSGWMVENGLATEEENPEA
jgi:hypothetical protein